MAKKKINLAKVIYDSYPYSGDLPIEPEVHCKDLETLYEYVVNGIPISELGDNLFRFIVVEALEGGEEADGSVNADRVLSVLHRAIGDLQDVIAGIEDANV